jgi:hypothetical protein
MKKGEILTVASRYFVVGLWFPWVIVVSNIGSLGLQYAHNVVVWFLYCRSFGEVVSRGYSTNTMCKDEGQEEEE